MKPEPCNQYRDEIEQYTCGELSSADGERLLEHVQQCDGCRSYLDALNEQESRIKQWAQSLEPLMAAGQSQVIERLQLIPEPVAGTSGLNRYWWRYVGYAAAACVLIVSGYLAGGGMRPSVDMEALQKQWIASVQPALENKVAGSVLTSLRSDIKAEYAKMHEALSDQIGIGLQAYTEQTMVRNDVQVYQLLTELIEVIEAAQMENQQWALAAMAELEKQRFEDQETVQNQVALLAAYTDNELYRTKQAIQTLTAEQNEPANLN